MTTYQIRIDDHLYESNKDFFTALDLYNSVDETCLEAYIGHAKTLVQVDCGKEKTLRRGVITIVDPMQIRANECPFDFKENPQGWLDYMV